MQTLEAGERRQVLKARPANPTVMLVEGGEGGSEAGWWVVGALSPASVMLVPHRRRSRRLAARDGERASVARWSSLTAEHPYRESEVRPFMPATRSRWTPDVNFGGSTKSALRQRSKRVSLATTATQ